MPRPRSIPLCLACVAVLLSTATPALALTFGALGDSLTDEYLGRPENFGTTDLPAQNWVQHLVSERDLHFGSFEPDPAVRGESRNEGYEHNWARSGGSVLPNPFGFADVTTQASGLAGAAANGDVDIVFVGIGSNDFFYRELLGGPMSGPSFDAFQQALFDTTYAAIDTLQAAGPVDIVLNRLPAGTAGGVNPVTLAAIESTNALLLAEAASRGIPVIDLFAFTLDPDRIDDDENLSIGGWLVPVDSVASLADTVPAGTPGAGPCNSNGECATREYAMNFIASDTIHPNSIVQGLMANEFLGGINDAFQLDIPLLSDQEIIRAAVPEPGTALLVGLGLGAFAVGQRTRRPR